MSENLVREKHLVSVESAIKSYVDSQEQGTTGGAVLDSVPSTVDGGLWYETTSTAPIIKFKQGGSTYYLYTNQLVSPNLTLSSSTVTATSGASQTVTLTYSGEGTVTLSNPNETALTASYNSSTKTITLTSNLATGAEPVSVNLGIALSEAGTYAADSQTLAVTCQGGLLNPQLTITPSETSISETVTATVSYLGTGTISVTPSNTWHDDYSYDANTHTITITYSGKTLFEFDGEEFTVSLSASGSYNSATTSFIVYMS